MRTHFCSQRPCCVLSTQAELNSSVSCLQSLCALLEVACPGSPAHTAFFVQENLLPRGLAVFRRALQPDRGAGCQWGHHSTQAQRQHPGERQLLHFLFLRPNHDADFSFFLSANSLSGSLGGNGVVTSVHGGEKGSVLLAALSDHLQFWVLLHLSSCTSICWVSSGFFLPGTRLHKFLLMLCHSCHTGHLPLLEQGVCPFTQAQAAPCSTSSPVHSPSLQMPHPSWRRVRVCG